MDKKGLLSIHIAVFLFGASGLFVKLIPMSVFLITLSRALFSALALYMFVHYRHLSLRLNRLRDYFWNILAGIFLTIHWIFYILSIQVSTVYIGTIIYATYPMFVFIIEPYAFKEKFQMKNLLCILLIGIGIAFLIPAFELNNSTTLGIIYGLISSFSFAILLVINRRLAFHYDSAVITMYEQAVVAIIMTLLISVTNVSLGEGTMIHFIELLIYALVFTALGHSLYINGLANIKAQTASVISVLEPVYSVFLAMIFLNERLSYQDMIGTIVIFLAVIIATLKKGDNNEEIPSTNT